MPTDLKLERVTLKPVPVVVVVEKGPPHEVAPRAFERLEAAVGSLRDRKLYGYYSPFTREYKACVALASDADAKGLERETLPGGRYLRTRLTGEPPKLYARIAPIFDQMVLAADTKDFERPWIEFYAAPDEVQLLVPIL